MRKTRFLAIVAVALLPLFSIASCGSPPTAPKPPVVDPPDPPDPPPPPPPPDPPTLTVTRFLAFGDSLTEGASKGQPLMPWGNGLSSHFDASTTYPSKLQAIFDEIYTDQTITVTNAGKGGERIDGAAKDRLLDEIDDHNPQVLLLLHGVNNLVGGVNAQIAGSSIDDEDIVREAADWLDELIEKAREHKPGLEIFVATLPQQVTGASTKTKAARLVEPYNAAVKRLAAEEKVPVVDIYSVISAPMLMLDGLHINEEGNEKMAEAFYAKIKTKFHKAPSTIR